MPRLHRITLAAIALVGASVAPLHAEPSFVETFRPGLKGTVLMQSVPEDYEDACLDACASIKGCVGYDRDDAGQCRLYSAHQADPSGTGLWLVLNFDREDEERARRAELAGVLHGDVFERIARLHAEQLMLFDGSYVDVRRSVFETLAARDYDSALPRLDALAVTAKNSEQLQELAGVTLDAVLSKDFTGDVAIAQSMKSAAITYGVMAYLKSLGDEGRFIAATALADQFARIGDRRNAAGIGRFALSIRSDDVFQASVETWESETPEGAEVNPVTDGTVLRETDGAVHLTCDNAGACAAGFYPADGETEEAGAWLEIARDAGALGAVRARLYLATYGKFEEKARRGDVLEHLALVLDGAATDGLSGALISGNGDSIARRIDIAPSKLRPLIDAALQSRSITVTLDGETIATIETGGAKAALQTIDRVQRLTASPLALIDPVRSGVFQPAEPAALPIVSAPLVRMGMVQTRVPAPVVAAWTEACEGENDVDAEGQPVKGGQGVVLGDGREVWLVNCSSGAHSVSAFAFLLDQGQARLLNHDTIGETGLEASAEELMGAVFEARRDADGPGRPIDTDNADTAMMLMVQARDGGRGFGDCGHVHDFVFDGEALRLVRAARMDFCRGNGWAWPVIFRADLRASATVEEAADDSAARDDGRLTRAQLSAPFRECQEAVAGEEEPMLACVAAEMKQWDGRLNAAYKVLKTRFAESDPGGEALARLKTAQKAWITTRDQTCKVERIMHADANAAFFEAFCLLKLTALRTEMLENLKEMEE